MNVIGVSHVKMGTKHCTSRLMPHMNTSTSVRKRDLKVVKMNGPPKNARKSAKRSRSATKVVKSIVRTHATNVAIKDSFY